MSSGEIPSTAFTASTLMPITCSPSGCSISTITMQLYLVTGALCRPKRVARSITGTTEPRRLITPQMQAGISGTWVRVPYSMISLTDMMPMPNVSPFSMKVRYWAWSMSDASSASSASALRLSARSRIMPSSIAGEICLIAGIAMRAVGLGRAFAGLGRIFLGGLGRARGGASPDAFGADTAGAAFDLEEADGLLQLFGLTAHFLGRGSQLFRTRGVLLSRHAQLTDRRVDLADARRLLLGCRGDFLHQVGSALDIGHHLGERDTGALGQFDAVRSYLADLLRGDLAALGQLAHLGRHHGKALAVSSRARSFDGRIQ